MKHHTCTEEASILHQGRSNTSKSTELLDGTQDLRLRIGKVASVDTARLTCELVSPIRTAHQANSTPRDDDICTSISSTEDPRARPSDLQVRRLEKPAPCSEIL